MAQTCAQKYDTSNENIELSTELFSVDGEERYFIKETVLKEKPAGIKGNFLLSAFLTSTMGVSYKLKQKA